MASQAKRPPPPDADQQPTTGVAGTPGTAGKRVGRPKKIQRLTAGDSAQPSPTVTPRLSPVRVLPDKLVDDDPLPTLASPQPFLPSPTSTPAEANDEYQSLAASGVLAASLDRTRRKWVSGKLFERFWTKPSTKKDAPPPPENNPAKGSMREVGRCAIAVPPVVVEAVVYVVKDTVNATGGGTGKQGGSQPGQKAAGPGTHGGPGRPQAPAQPPQRAALAPDKSGHDPVIQMLARRASTDPELKKLMKTVAAQQATPEQVRRFQRHIEELSELVARQQAQQQQQRPPAAGQVQPAAGVPARPAPMKPPPPPTQTATATPPQRPTVVLEFLGPHSSSDRFLFPANSIVEVTAPGTMLASFLILEQAPDGTRYHEPVTMMITSAEPKSSTKDPLSFMQRCVNPPDAVRTWMEQQFETTTRAPDRFLALRLPHVPKVLDESEGKGLEGAEEDGHTEAEAAATGQPQSPRANQEKSHSRRKSKPKTEPQQQTATARGSEPKKRKHSLAADTPALPTPTPFKTEEERIKEIEQSAAQDLGSGGGLRASRRLSRR